MTSTTAVILAAGVGSRLRPLTDLVPKCLVEVGGDPILRHQFRALREAGLSDIIVVAGYRAQQVRDAVNGHARVIENGEYEITNNMFSLSLALPYVSADAIILNGDVVFDSDTIRVLREDAFSDAIAVDACRYLEESMKVRTRADGSIEHISKAIPAAEAFGCSIDLYKFSATTMSSLRAIVSSCIEGGDRKQWTEVAIDRMLADVKVYPLPIGSRRWVEIDNFDDLSEANKLWSRVTS